MIEDFLNPAVYDNLKADKFWHTHTHTHTHTHWNDLTHWHLQLLSDVYSVDSLTLVQKQT